MAEVNGACALRTCHAPAAASSHARISRAPPPACPAPPVAEPPVRPAPAGTGAGAAGTGGGGRGAPGVPGTGEPEPAAVQVLWPADRAARPPSTLVGGPEVREPPAPVAVWAGAAALPGSACRSETLLAPAPRVTGL